VAALGLVALVGWFALRASPPVDVLESEAPASLAAVPPGSGAPAGGYSDGSGDRRTAPAPRAQTLKQSSADDGVLRVLVLGDEQALGEGSWPAIAGQVLQDRLAPAPAPWPTVRVEVTTAGAPGWTAAHAWAWLSAQEPGPELILVSLGWNDGRAGSPALGPPPAPAADRQWYLDELAALGALRHVGVDSGFYLDGAAEPRLAVDDHLRALDSLAVRAAELGAALVYVEQPVLRSEGPRTVFASTAMRPQPWILLAPALEAQPDAAALFGQAPTLTPTGHEAVGRYVGEGLVATVLAAQ